MLTVEQRLNSMNPSALLGVYKALGIRYIRVTEEATNLISSIHADVSRVDKLPPLAKRLRAQSSLMKKINARLDNLKTEKTD